MMMMSAEEKFQIIWSIGEECIKDDELLNLLAKKPQPICYDVFEPSGQMHIAQGVMKTMIVNKLTSAGCKVKIWIADGFAQLSKKMGGDLEKIRTVGEYMVEIWKAAGMDLENVEFLWSSEEYNSKAHEYWPLVTDVARKFKVSSLMSCGDDSTAAQIFYPCMQCADVIFLKADICLLGKDQQNVLAREFCASIEPRDKPIILSHHMLPELLKGREKMSKSDPSLAIFMEDEEADVVAKIRKAYCPPNDVEGNPCLEYIKHIVFPCLNEFKVESKEKPGGEKVFTTYEELIIDYQKGELHPGDVKAALSKALNRILQPIRDHFKNDQKAKDLREKVKIFTTLVTTRTLNRRISSLAVTSLSNSNPATTPMMTMSAEEKFRIIRSIGEECIKDNELLNLLANKPQPICYDGFEPSGRMHIAQGVMKTLNVNKLTSAGCKVKIWIADWFAQLNNKMGGDLERIKTVGEYMIEIWKAAGMDLENVEFLWSSEEINSKAHEYWPLVLDIARKNNVSRIMRCCQIMGRSEGHDLTAAQMFYPCMQCADVIFLKADICQLGMDQRKVNVLAREYCTSIKQTHKPIILSHHMLPGFKGQEKMSKSDPSSAIFMEDEEADVVDKIGGAYCPPTDVEGNPCLEYIKDIVFPSFNEFKVESKEKPGGEKVFTTYEELIIDYQKGELLPHDVKAALSKALNRILQRIRDHFKNDQKAKELTGEG